MEINREYHIKKNQVRVLITLSSLEVQPNSKYFRIHKLYKIKERQTWKILV